MPEQRRVAREAGRRRLRVRRRRAADREPLDQRAVDAHVELLRRAETADVVGIRALQSQPDRVLAVHRKAVAYRDAAARAERQVLAEPPVLVQEQGYAVRVHACHRRRHPHRETTDPARRRQVALEERRRDRQDRGHVVEAVRVRVVGRQERRHVHVDVQQVPDRVAVLGAVQAVERLGATHARLVGSGTVQRRLEIRDRLPRRGARGTGPAGGRHRADAQLADDLFPDARIVRDRRRVRGIEREPGRAQPLVVTRDAVAVEQRAHRRSVRRGRRLGRGQRGAAEGAEGGEADHDARERTDPHPACDLVPAIPLMVPDGRSVVNGRRRVVVC